MMGTDLISAGALALQNGKQAPKIGQVDSAKKAREVAVQFEAFFLGQMLQPMFANLKADPPFGGGHAEQVWRSLMVDEYGKAMAEAGGIGIADQVQREILRIQEARNQ